MCFFFKEKCKHASKLQNQIKKKNPALKWQTNLTHSVIWIVSWIKTYNQIPYWFTQFIWEFIMHILPFFLIYFSKIIIVLSLIFCPWINHEQNLGKIVVLRFCKGKNGLGQLRVTRNPFRRSWAKEMNELNKTNSG
jgi:hypothetical protein